ncbi:MAG: hypothetical protein WCD56_03400 [Pseudolabrys sp.]
MGSYLREMMRGPLQILLLALTGALSVVPAFAQSDIMVPEKGYKAEKPEPWLAPKYKSPRGTVKRVTIPKSTIVQPPSAAVPPPIVVPQTGRVLPNLPTVSGSGRGGAETYQDRAARCAHQAGVYGQAAGDRNTYIGTCINQ